MINFVLQQKHRNLLKKISLGILGLLGAGVILFLTNLHGVGLTPDSVSYISTARSLAEGNGFTLYNGLYYIAQPPLYPILLFVIKITKFIDPLISAGYVNAALFGFTIYLSGLLLLKYLNSFALILLGTISVLISTTLVQASLMALSELLFIFLFLLFLFYWEKFQTKGDIVSLFLFSVLAALSCLTRYVGITVIFTGIISILLLKKNSSKEKFRHSLFFLFITTLPIGIWILRNYFLSDTLVGQRAYSSYTLFENFKFFYNTVLPWFLPSDLTWLYFIIISLTVTMWIIFGSDSVKLSIRKMITLIGPSLIFVLFFSGIIILSSSTTAYDKITNRLLSPIYIPIVFILFFICDRILKWLTEFFPKKLTTILFIMGIVFLIKFPVENTVHVIKVYNELRGYGYNSTSWRESDIIKYLAGHKQLGKGFTLYSNEPSAIYIHTGLKPKRSPSKTFYNSSQPYEITQKRKEIWQSGESICLIWFNKTSHKFLFALDELQKEIDMNEIVHLKSGRIFTFTIE